MHELIIIDRDQYNLDEKIFSNIHHPTVTSMCQTIKIPLPTKDSQATWKTVTIMIESHGHEVNWVTYILSKHARNDNENDIL